MCLVYCAFCESFVICVVSVVGAGRGYLGCLKRFGVQGGLAWVAFFGKEF